MTANKHTPMVVAAARALCRRASELCNVDFDDNWKLYGDDFLTDAQVTLEAVAAPELLEALIEAVVCGMVPISSAVEGGASAYSAQVRCADKIRAAIAKATGGAA